MESIYPITITGTFKILNETDNLKYFGNGRKLNGVDLATCVVGHNLSMKKIHLKKLVGLVINLMDGVWKIHILEHVQLHLETLLFLYLVQVFII